MMYMDGVVCRNWIMEQFNAVAALLNISRWSY